MLQYYKGSILVSIVAVVLGYLIGGVTGATIVAILAVLETSLSFDNAVVNASILKNWDEKWRQRFLIWGMPIAVFGMRLIFPIAIVSVVASMTPLAAFNMAITDPKQYEHVLVSVHHEIAAFGGTFLLMVFLKFFLDHNKDVHWIAAIEKPLSRVGRVDMAEVVFALAVIFVTHYYVDPAEQLAFVLAGVAGLITYIIADGVGSLVGDEEEDGGQQLTTNIVKQGIAGFMYLELLDASFSFDGVIAAFAITNNIFIIMIGLAVGAMFVRSMTIHLVAKGTLAELVYLEHSAFWAIGALAILMFTGIVIEVPEVVVGLIGAAMIAAGAIHSKMELKKADNTSSTVTN